MPMRRTRSGTPSTVIENVSPSCTATSSRIGRTTVGSGGAVDVDGRGDEVSGTTTEGTAEVAAGGELVGAGSVGTAADESVTGVGSPVAVVPPGASPVEQPVISASASTAPA